jgi:hypothetical protein
MIILGLSAYPARSQTIGPSPPTRTTTVTVTSGVTTVVGNTIISTTGATPATNVTGGTLNVDTNVAPTPGPITVQTVNGNALQANGGTERHYAPDERRATTLSLGRCNSSRLCLRLRRKRPTHLMVSPTVLSDILIQL